MTMRGGAAYVGSLRDGRAVFLDGERVDDVTKHPAFVEPIRKIAETYDRGPAAPDVPTVVDPATGRHFGAMWLIPRSADDIEIRRRVHRFWAEPSYGLMGRTPDHVASVITALASWRQLFDRAGRQFGDNVVKFWEKARAEDLYLSYAIVPPQIDRSQPAHRQPEPFLYPGVVRERDHGIVVRGCQAIATSTAMADWLFLSYITPLAPGDDDYALSLVMPMNAEGLKLYPRRPFAAQATSVYDYPLSARFDELDVHAAQRFPLLSEGVARPHPQYVYAGMSLQRRLIVDLMRAVRELAGGAFQALPSSLAAFDSPETRADTERYYRSGVASARDRVKLLKLIWDMVGTEFAGRQLQYEMFYSAAQPVVNARMFRAYDWTSAKAMVDRCLGEY